MRRLTRKISGCWRLWYVPREQYTALMLKFTQFARRMRETIQQLTISYQERLDVADSLIREAKEETAKVKFEAMEAAREIRAENSILKARVEALESSIKDEQKRTQEKQDALDKVCGLTEEHIGLRMKEGAQEYGADFMPGRVVVIIQFDQHQIYACKSREAAFYEVIVNRIAKHYMRIGQENGILTFVPDSLLLEHKRSQLRDSRSQVLTIEAECSNS